MYASEERMLLKYGNTLLKYRKNLPGCLTYWFISGKYTGTQNNKTTVQN